MPYLENEPSSYEEAFACVEGVTVEWAEYYGSYQGNFLCKIQKAGETLYIYDSYGSCSGCDSFQAEFGWSTYYYESEGVTQEERLAHVKQRMAKWSFSYIESALPLQQMMNYLQNECGQWDDEAIKALKRLEENP